MKTTLTALSLMLVLGSVSSVQAATFTGTHDVAAQHRTTVSSDVSVTRNTVVSPAEGDFAATHTVNTHLGTFGVDANRIDSMRPDGAKKGASDANCNVNPGNCNGKP